MLQPPVPVHHADRLTSRPTADGFNLLLFLTIPAAFLYLSGAARVILHDVLYTMLLGAVWDLYFASDSMLRMLLGPLLMGTPRLLLLVGLFGLVYWIVLTHP